VRQLVEQQVAAAQHNPFLRVPPTVPREYVEYLADRLDYAQRLGDAARVAQVLQQASQYIEFRDHKVARFVMPSNLKPKAGKNPATLPPIAYAIEPIRQLANTEGAAHNRRAKALIMMFDYAHKQYLAKLREDRFRVRPPALPPEVFDPDTAAAVRRQNADERLFQSWKEFKTKFGITIRSDQNEIRRAFRIWASGDYVSSPGKTASLAASRHVADITAVLAKSYTFPEAPVPPEAQEAITLRQVAELQARLKASTDLAEREAITDELRSLPSLKDASENIGEAAAKMFVANRFGVDPNTGITRRGAGIPDLIFVDPESGNLVIIEAKGGNSPKGARLDMTGRKMVQQGTKEYLESLAETMKLSTDPAIRKLGSDLETMLKQGKVLYFLVRQLYNAADGTLETPIVEEYDVSKGGAPRK
jgi:hypothetical protein